MLAPQSKVGAIKGAYAPGKILGVGRTSEIAWGPLPPTDGTPVQFMECVVAELQQRYPLFGNELDPAKKDLYRKKVARDFLGPVTLAIEQTFQLMQQYEDDDELAKVAGDLQTPFHISKAEIQGRHNITATIDTKMLDEDYNKDRAALIAQSVAFKGDPVLFNLLLEGIDPDVAELLDVSQASPAAMDKERQDEKNAIAQAFTGQVPDKPLSANNQ